MPRATHLDTIVAVATPPGAGALAIVRVSGPDAMSLVDACFSGRRPLAEMEGFQGAVGMLRDGPRAVDEVVAWVYRAPASYTGENMVEISCHGGGVSAERVMDVVLAAGARPAEAGEFTRRAFVNGRIDLAQAEAVATVIAARGRRAHELALGQLAGGLSARVRELAAGIRDALVRLEAHLDFGDDVPRAPDADELLGAMAAARLGLVELAGTYAAGRLARRGWTVALVGAPNAGKSSLLNRLAHTDRALVHETPGTTRDVVDVALEWDGIPVRLVDTAGLRSTPEPVEAAGVERSRRVAADADVLLWVADGSREPTGEDRRLAEEMLAENTVLVLNKADLPTQTPVHGWVNGHSPRAVHRVSALTGEGISVLVEELRGWLSGGEASGEAAGTGAVAVMEERHVHELRTAQDALERGAAILERGEPVELAAADLHRALEALAAITGDHAGDDLLNAIFQRFCIGK